MYLNADFPIGNRAMDRDPFTYFAAYNILQIIRQAGKLKRREESLETEEWKTKVFH